jgi:hypothetical protein
MRFALLFILSALVNSACAAGQAYRLKPEWQGPCQKRDRIDVNLGQTPERFVQACGCQITGKLPDPAEVKAWAARLRAEGSLRRVDVVRSLLKQAGREAPLEYSDPWVDHPELPAPGPKTSKRDIGAILMFFFHCPGGVNCGMDWAGNHVLGMQKPSPLLAFNGKPGYYTAANPGFWVRELRDARGAGLDFVLPNVYGPDMVNDGWIKTLAEALKAEDAGVKIGLMDDPWAWGEPWFGNYWKQKPNLDVPNQAAKLLYDSKWKPFFSTVPKASWYTVDGRPFIYVYNSGKLEPLNRSSATFSRMKALFRADFGVEPFLVVDKAYFKDDGMALVADGKYTWNPLHYKDGPDMLSVNSMRGKRLTHAMPRWDAVGRDHPGKIADGGDGLLKGPEQLQKALEGSRDSDFLVLATWNDLGEGTCINRAYDYWYQGHWMQPDYFLRMIRAERSRPTQ